MKTTEVALDQGISVKHLPPASETLTDWSAATQDPPPFRHTESYLRILDTENAVGQQLGCKEGSLRGSSPSHVKTLCKQPHGFICAFQSHQSSDHDLYNTNLIYRTCLMKKCNKKMKSFILLFIV